MATIYDLETNAKVIAQQQAIIDRQRNALQVLLNAIWIHINAPDDNGEQLQDAYRLVSSASTMIGTSEISPCKWIEKDEYWETDCGNKYVINDGTPKENNMKFCTYCGLIIESWPMI